VSWPVVKLGSLFKVTSGGTPSRSVAEYYEDGQIPWVKTGDLHNKYVEQASEYITEAGLKSSSTRLYPAGTVLVAMYGATIGACSILAIEACTNQACAAFTPNPQVDVDYLYYFLKHSKAAFVNAGAGGAQPNISAGFLKEYEIPLPPLAEQKRIAAILDKADAIRRKRQQAIQLADDFLRAVFLEMFGDPVTNPKGWEVKSLRDVLKSISSGWSANGDSRPCEEGELGVLKISAVTSGTFIPTENKAVQVSDIPSSKKLVFPKKGDMLFSRANTRELVAASCIVVEESLNTFLPDKLWLIKTDESQLLPEFLNYLLKIPGFKEKLTSQATGSSGSMLNISMGKFEETVCPVPEIDLQHRFKKLYWKLQETMSCFEQSYSTLQASFNSLSQKAFSGQL
jgi:type I restriction enzyme S subunit